MMLAGTWIAGVLLAVGPNGWWLDARLQAEDDVYHRLVPIEWLDDTPRSLWITFHRRDSWVMAIYLPPAAEELRWAQAFPEVASSQFDRLLPGLDVPRLILSESVYRAAGSDLVELSSLAVDSSETLYNALLDAHVDLAARRGEPWTAELRTRAQDVMTAVPEEHRVEAFRNAVIDFGSHLLSLASEVARHSRRHAPERLCALLDPPRALFGGWQRAFSSGSFPGRWQRLADPATGLRGESVVTREILRVDDRRWVAEEILGAGWTGDPARDFAWFCE